MHLFKVRMRVLRAERELTRHSSPPRWASRAKRSTPLKKPDFTQTSGSDLGLPASLGSRSRKCLYTRIFEEVSRLTEYPRTGIIP
jgi:hypothetical protein